MGDQRLLNIRAEVYHYAKLRPQRRVIPRRAAQFPTPRRALLFSNFMSPPSAICTALAAARLIIVGQCHILGRSSRGSTLT